MHISYRTDGIILYVAIEGRVDSSNAAIVAEQIDQIKNDHPNTHTVIDAEKLVYVSSAGLRVILKLKKQEPKLAMINVSADLYSILELTGFTEIITIEKAYEKISIEGCQFLAKGGNGAVYRYDEETIVKVFYAKDALPEIKQERENARRAFVLGINTAIPYGIVRVGDGYGTVAELLNAVSVSQLMSENPNDTSAAVNHYVTMLKSIHEIEVSVGEFPNMKQTALSWVDFLAEHMPMEQYKKLRWLVENVPDTNNLMHGDYHPNNVLIQNGEPLLIDMDTLCIGHPIFEFGSMYNAFVGFSELDPENIVKFLGCSLETTESFWKTSLKLYLGTDDEKLLNEVIDKARVIGYTRLLRRSIRRSEEANSAEKIAHYKKMLCMLVDKIDALTF